VTEIIFWLLDQHAQTIDRHHAAHLISRLEQTLPEQARALREILGIAPTEA
jgi:hypothetical protein